MRVKLYAASLMLSCAACGMSESTPENNSPFSEIDDLRTRTDAIREGAKRSNDEMHARVAAEKAGEVQPPEPGLHHWIVNATISACPSASDWYGVVDAVERGDMSVDLPPRCYQIRPGTKIWAKDYGLREVKMHGHSAFEQARREDGALFWTDELDKITISKLPGASGDRGTACDPKLAKQVGLTCSI